jgi:hypothetical protein
VLNILSPAPFPITEDEPSLKIPKPLRFVDKEIGSLKSNDSEKPLPYKSPAFDDVEKEFKDQLLYFTTEILLRDVDLLKNIADRGSKVLFHVEQLKQLIAILYLKREDRNNYDELIEIETEKVPTNSCFCKDFYNPFYLSIKNIYVLNRINFLTTRLAVNMERVFKISLEKCLTG